MKTNKTYAVITDTTGANPPRVIVDSAFHLASHLEESFEERAEGDPAIAKIIEKEGNLDSGDLAYLQIDVKRFDTIEGAYDYAIEALPAERRAEITGEAKGTGECLVENSDEADVDELTFDGDDAYDEANQMIGFVSDERPRSVEAELYRRELRSALGDRTVLGGEGAYVIASDGLLNLGIED